jgi:DNA polymerase V
MKALTLNNLDTNSFCRVIEEDIEIEIPFVSLKVPAGLPCPADQYIEESINLNKVLIRKPQATFCIRVVGDSMIDAGIREDDILVVDSSIVPTHNKIVVAAVDGDLTVKRLCFNMGKVLLCSENKKYSPIEVKNKELNIWGVVTFVIHKA